MGNQAHTPSRLIVSAHALSRIEAARVFVRRVFVGRVFVGRAFVGQVLVGRVPEGRSANEKLFVVAARIAACTD